MPYIKRIRHLSQTLGDGSFLFENRLKPILNEVDAGCDAVAELYLRYHQVDVAERYDKIIEVETFDILQEEQLTKMQLMLLEEMHGREIVIETLPTSNVVIGNHHDYNTYHLYNWYQLVKSEHVQSIRTVKSVS